MWSARKSPLSPSCPVLLPKPWRKECRAPLEQELYALTGIRDVQSTNKNEVSIVKAEFEYGKDLNTATVDVNNAISRARGKLPPEAAPSAVYAVGGFTQPVMVLALSPKPGSDVSLTQIRLIAENDMRTALLTQGHIANVEVFGGHEPTDPGGV
jgi:multidrug efflux pump subunit AcrB